jgi:hypothetical protein
LGLRSQMFDSSFYNAGYAVSSIGEFEPFLKSIPDDKYPRYLVVSLDQWMFNGAWDNLKAIPDRNKWSASFQTFPDLRTVQSVWRDFLRGKYHKGLRDSVVRIGINAGMFNTGFQNDGSMYYGGQIRKLLSGDSTANDYNFRDTYKRIEKGIKKFEHGDTMNGNALKTLDRLLRFCQEKNISVIGFLPPFADKVNQRMEQSGKYGYMREIYPAVKKLFDRHRFEFYDFSHLASCGSDDTEMIDGFHGGELTYLKVVIKMLERNSVLNEAADLGKLTRAVNTPLNRYLVY